MKYCILCGTKLVTKAKFCSNCGERCQFNNSNKNKEVETQIDLGEIFKKYAFYFYNLGLNITCISDQKNEYNSKADNLYLKAPNHTWEHLSGERQPLEEFNSYPWETSTGFGVATGLNNLITIDFDNCSPEFLVQVLESLSLPYDYEWVVLSGGRKGFHIYIFVDDVLVNFAKETVVRLFPKPEYKQQIEKVELLIRLHSILPPSLHPTKNKYEFINCEKPIKRPARIEFSILENFIQSFFDVSKQKNLLKYKRKNKVLKLLQRIEKKYLKI
ncbi:bifunctional DNA primase/polymerase [Patescibacteria group bacterium]|nr:bifunctional DNA primase/polymerase [Patescibacteria group bacterium]